MSGWGVVMHPGKMKGQKVTRLRVGKIGRMDGEYRAHEGLFCSIAFGVRITSLYPPCSAGVSVICS